MASGVTLSGTYSDAHAFGYSISPAEGQSVSAFVGGFPKCLLSSGNVVIAGAGWQGFLSLPARNHVLAMRAALGSGFGDSSLARSFYAGGAQGAFKLRGFRVDSVPTAFVASTGLDYRFPLFRVEHGLGLFPVFLNTVSGAVFAEAGAGWNAGPIPKMGQLRADAGTELKLDCVVGYLLPITVQAGVARGFRRADEFQVYVNLNSPLLTELLGETRRANRLGYPSLLQQTGNLLP
jgi:hypothetical protein